MLTVILYGLRLLIVHILKTFTDSVANTTLVPLYSLVQTQNPHFPQILPTINPAPYQTAFTDSGLLTVCCGSVV